MKRPYLLVLCILMLSCATGGEVRHRATVTVATSHAVLTLVDDTEMRVVCDRLGAPSPPFCVPPEAHRRISALLARAYGLEAQVARIVRALPLNTPTPTEVSTLTVEIGRLVSEILALIPTSAEKAILIQKLEPIQGGGN